MPRPIKKKKKEIDYGHFSEIKKEIRGKKRKGKERKGKRKKRERKFLVS